MRRAVWLTGALSIAVAAAAAGQLVELTRCHAATPCSIPFGLRPSGSVANNPFANTGPGNAAIGVGTGLDGGFKLHWIRAPVSQDPVESAARLYVKKNPLKLRTVSTPTPTPRAP